MAAADALQLSYACGLDVQERVPLAPFTSLNVGGPADFLVKARGARELSKALSAAYDLSLPVLLLGGGSNMLVSDRGFHGLAIKTETPAGKRQTGDVLSESEEGVHLRCDSGIFTAGLSRWTAGMGWTGLEWACGIPGRLGGAVAGNAGAYGGDMAGCVERVLAWFPDGERTIGRAELAYGYRASRFKRGSELSAVLSAELHLDPGDRDAALARIEQNERNRREKQPTERSCGSMFKNPSSADGQILDYAGRLVEAAGLKGTCAGGAQISEKHGNFFINRGGATAADVLALVRQTRSRVQEVSGLRLEIEILLIGEWLPEEVADL
jgi:UDP-N-acetylmuramate dehydrogenase